MTTTPPITDSQALDRFIAGNAPGWLKNASLAELDELREALASHHRCQARVSDLLATLQAPQDFALPRLASALQALGCNPQPQQALWREVRLRVEQPVFRVTDVDLPSFHRYPLDSELLPRLLGNFDAGQASAGYYYPGAGIVAAGELLPCPPERVAARCRELDLGGAYQSHLAEVLTPGDEGKRQQVLDLFVDDQRATLVAHARTAYLKGDIDAAARQLLLDLAAGTPAPGGEPQVRAGGLQLLGFAVPGALLLESASESRQWPGQTMAGQVLLYLANDPSRPLRQAASLAGLGDQLGTDLRYPDYVDFLTRQLQRDDRLSFLGKLQSALNEPRPLLQVKGLAAEPQPLHNLVQQRIARIKTDAAQLLVPTAAVDQALHRQRLEALKSAGLTVTGVLASFIPGIGELMLVGLVKDLLSEVYEGVVEWSHGQHAEALDHLLGVLGNLALGALVATGSAVALRELRRSTFVDGLLPVRCDDGGQRLWSAQRSRHALPLALTAPVDADGLVHVQGRHWWRSGEQLFEVRQASADGRWRIVHPSRDDAWTPELRGNGDGAWWHGGEDPLQWQGEAMLLRRLGPRSEGLSDTACEQVAAICGYDQARLRGLLVERRPMPAELVQVLADFRLDARLARFFGQLGDGLAPGSLDQELCDAARELRPGADAGGWQTDARALRPALFELLAGRMAPPPESAGMPLQRLFPGLPTRFVNALLEEAPLPADGRVPLALQERAVQSLREVRVLHALEGLYLDARCGSDTLRLVFSLFRRLPAWPRGLSFELREGAFDGPVLERLLPLGEAHEIKVLTGGLGSFRSFDSRGTALAAAPTDLFQALLDGLGPVRGQALGCPDASALRGLLREQAGSDRERLPGLLGISPPSTYFRAPQRFTDGRLGYPLSGRGRPGSFTLTAMVRSLYPGFSDLEASIWLDEIQQLHGDPMAELLRRQESLRTLDQVLARWLQETPLLGRTARRRVAEEVRRCWCRQAPAVLDVDGRHLGYRLRLSRSFGGDLPPLPDSVDFSHVVDLVLSGAGQTNRVNGFLQGFGQLRWLDLGHNACSEIPTALARMSELRELYMDGNAVRLSDVGQGVLSSLQRLEVLHLDGNPLQRSPDVGPLLHLRRLSLRGTGLRTLPAGLLSRPVLELADLRGNQLEALPEGFFSAPVRIRNATVLFGNPLRREMRERLWMAGEGDGLVVGAGSADGAREQWLAGLHDDLLRERDGQWQGLLAEPGSEAFFSLLGKLLDTAEYRLAPEHLQGRVWQMIGAAVNNSALRESLFELANAPTTCVDSVVSSFSVLDVHLQVSEAAGRAASADQGGALLDFARRLFRLDRLEAHARKVIEQRRLLGDTVDEVEVSLAFRVHLGEALQLPGQPRHMQFGDIAAVSEADLLWARQVVEEAEAGAQLADFIARQDFWIDYLRGLHGTDFRRVEGRFWDAMERLCEQQGQMPEGDYLQRMNQLGSDREQALHEQLLIFTRQALDASPQH